MCLWQREKSANLYVLDEHLMREEETRRTEERKQEKEISNDWLKLQESRALGFTVWLSTYCCYILDHLFCSQEKYKVCNKQLGRGRSEGWTEQQDRNNRDMTVFRCQNGEHGRPSWILLDKNQFMQQKQSRQSRGYESQSAPTCNNRAHNTKSKKKTQRVKMWNQSTEKQIFPFLH